MADFCQQCSIEFFGEDTGDLRYDRERELLPGYGWIELCEGCGHILINNDGRCIYHCDKDHLRLDCAKMMWDMLLPLYG